MLEADSAGGPNATTTHRQLEEQVVDLFKQLSDTLQSIKNTNTHSCVIDLIASATADQEANRDSSKAGATNLGPSTLPEPLDARTTQLREHSLQLQQKDEVISAKDAQIQNLTKDLGRRDEAYGRLLGAHQIVLKRLEHCQRALGYGASDSTASDPGGRPKGADKSLEQRTKLRGPGTTPETPVPRDEVLPRGPASMRQSQSFRANSAPSSSQVVEFVSERPVRHARRQPTRAKTGDHELPPRSIKQETSPPRRPTLASIGTSLIDGLDLDGTELAKSTPRKVRQSPLHGLENFVDFVRPSSAPHDTQDPLPQADTRSDGTRSFSGPASFEAVETNPEKSHLDTLDVRTTSRPHAETIHILDSDEADEQPMNVSPDTRHKEPQAQSPARTVLSERDPNVRITPHAYSFNTAKSSGKRRRDSHGASKIGELAEDGSNGSPGKRKTKKMRRLHDLLDGRAGETPKIPSSQKLVPPSESSMVKSQAMRNRVRDDRAHDLGLLDTNAMAGMDQEAAPGKFATGNIYQHLPNCTCSACNTSTARAGQFVTPPWLTKRAPIAADDRLSAIPRPDIHQPAIRSPQIVNLSRLTAQASTSREGDDRPSAHESGPIYERAGSPTGFWRADMPSTQELEIARKKMAQAAGRAG